MPANSIGPPPAAAAVGAHQPHAPKLVAADVHRQQNLVNVGSTPKPRKVAIAHHARNVQVHMHAHVARAVRSTGMRYVALKDEDIARTQYNGYRRIRALIAHHEPRSALHAKDHRGRLAWQILTQIGIKIPMQPLLAAAGQRVQGIYLAG